MANDIHVWLPDDMAAALKARAEHEMRSVTNMACVLIQRGLAVPGNALVAAEDRPRVGRPRTRASISDGPVAQLGARRNLTPEVAGSSPAGTANIPVTGTEFPVREVHQRGQGAGMRKTRS